MLWYNNAKKWVTNVQDRAKKYFLLADQYYEATKLLMNTIIDNDNTDCGIGNTEEEAMKNFEKAIVKSDVYLFIPSTFASLQTVELFIKGLLLLNNEEIEEKHEVCDMLKQLKKIYGEKSKIYIIIKDFYTNQMNILDEYKKENKITTTAELYESLRY